MSSAALALSATAQARSHASESAPLNGFGDPALDARWTAWVGKNQRHEQAVQRRVQIVVAVVACLAALVGAAFSLWRGAW
jgi:hypothetical protein